MSLGYNRGEIIALQFHSPSRRRVCVALNSLRKDCRRPDSTSSSESSVPNEYTIKSPVVKGEESKRSTSNPSSLSLLSV